MSPPRSLHDAADDDNELRTPQEALLSGIDPGGGMRPVILDPHDGMPRPDDEDIHADAVPSVTDENLVCTEGGAWMRWSHQGFDLEELPAPLREDGFVLNSFTAHPAPHGVQRLYTHEDDKGAHRFYVRARPACLHYAEALTDPGNVNIDSLDQRPRSVMRQCDKLQLDLVDAAMYACAVRSPRDVVSEKLLIERAREKRALAALVPTPMFRSQTDAERAATADADPADSDVAGVGYLVLQKANTVSPLGAVALHGPSSTIDDLLLSSPLYVFFPDACWQPKLPAFSERPYVDAAGKKRTWMASLSGENVLRFFRAKDQDMATLKGLQRQLLTGTIKGIAKAICEGRNVAIVSYYQSTATAILKEIHEAVDAYETPHPTDMGTPQLT